MLPVGRGPPLITLYQVLGSRRLGTLPTKPFASMATRNSRGRTSARGRGAILYSVTLAKERERERHATLLPWATARTQKTHTQRPARTRHTQTDATAKDARRTDTKHTHHNINNTHMCVYCPTMCNNRNNSARNISSFYCTTHKKCKCKNSFISSP